jgi:transposase, IS5 family
MRLAFNPQRRLDCLPIEVVRLNLNCRDEIVPILRALQHIYSASKLRREIFRSGG